MLIDYKNDAELKVPFKPLFRSSGKIGNDIRALRGRETGH